MNVAEYLLQNAYDDKTALIDNDCRCSYAELKGSIAVLEARLVEAGVKAASSVCIVASNSEFWVAAYLATIRLGAVAVPFCPTDVPEDLERLVKFASANAICLQRKYLSRFAGVVPSGTKVILDDILGERNSTSSLALIAPRTVDDQQDAALMPTSGTTSSPKLVRVTHRNIRANTESIIQSLGLTDNERILAALPFYYCFGTSLLHTHLRVGASLVLCSSFAYPEQALDLIEAEQCTGFAGVPSMFQALLRNSTFPKRRFPSLQKVQQAGGKLPTVQIEELLKILTDAKVFIMYGQTEATARLSCLSPTDLPGKLGSVGRGIPGVELRVVDNAGQDVLPGQVGEIVARGDNISPGYYKNPEASATKFVDGTLRTGDLAEVDDEGFIYVVDRKSDFIKSYGHRVSSQRVEETILRLTNVVEAAVVGLPDPVRGEAIVAFVVLRSGSSLSREDVFTYCRQSLPPYMCPKEIRLCNSLPKNAHGKVVKAQLLKDEESRITA